MRNIQHKLSVARGEKPAEIVFKNAQLVNVLSAEIYLTNVAVDDGRVIGFGDYDAKEIDRSRRRLSRAEFDRRTFPRRKHDGHDPGIRRARSCRTARARW